MLLCSYNYIHSHTLYFILKTSERVSRQALYRRSHLSTENRSSSSISQLFLLKMHSETNFAENHYYRLNQILLSTFNFWPYRRSMFSSISYAFQFVMLLSYVFFQVLVIVCHVLCTSYISCK